MSGRKERNRVAIRLAHRAAAELEPKVRRGALAFMRELGLSGRELSLALVGDRAIRRLNRAWRGTDRPTDVLSFPAGELAPGAPRPWPLGDVAISLDTARRVAAEEGVKLEDEVWRYLAHGLLHLLGFDHRRAADAGRMAQAERRLLGGRGMVSPGRGGARTRRRAASRPRTAPRVGR